MLTVITTFTARWTNYGDTEPRIRTFAAGETYTIRATRPEGVEVDGFFLFRKYLDNCRIS